MELVQRSQAAQEAFFLASNRRPLFRVSSKADVDSFGLAIEGRRRLSEG